MSSGPGLGQHVDGAGGQGLHGVGAVRAADEGAVDQDRRRAGGHDRLDRLDAAHDGQVEVHEHDGRPQPGDEGHGLAPVPGLAADREAGLGLHGGTQEAALHGAVVDDDDLEHGGVRGGGHAVHPARQRARASTWLGPGPAVEQPRLDVAGQRPGLGLLDDEAAGAQAVGVADGVRVAAPRRPRPARGGAAGRRAPRRRRPSGRRGRAGAAGAGRPGPPAGAARRASRRPDPRRDRIGRTCRVLEA